MAGYLLISSRDPLESGDAAAFYDLAASLTREGNDVTLFLVQNGVFPARPSATSELLTAAARAGVEILADELSLKERGIAADKLAGGVRSARLEVVVDQLAAGRKALWN